MRIGLDLLFLAPGVAGGRTYADELLRGLAAVDFENDYVSFTRRDTELPDLPPRFRQHRSPVSSRGELRRTAWEYGRLPSALARERCDLLHGLGNVAPASSRCPLVLTIHDLIGLRHPTSMGFGYRAFLKAVMPRVSARADRIIVPSHATARDVAALLPVDESRLRVVRYGPGNTALSPVADEETVDRAISRLGLHRPFLLTVARGYPHKNLAGLLRAFARLRAAGHRDVQLAVVGDPYRRAETRHLGRLARELDLEKSVVFTGFVGEESLSALLTAAAAFVFPSLAEGFGLPVLEAMACGAPVVASSVPAIAEAVGDAGLLADARDPEAFAAALERLLVDERLQSELRARGFERVKGFSWERAAAETLAIYEELR